MACLRCLDLTALVVSGGCSLVAEQVFFPAFAHPTKHHDAFGFTPEQFHYVFTNTLSEEDSQKVYDR